MHEPDQYAQLAAEYINTTDQHIFLTGKAGTGKTTFLKHIIANTYKHVVVAAPTGIAAINAGGVTLHSLLQLPFGAFVPEDISINQSYSKINTPRTLFSQSRFSAKKRKLINQIDLLIIDEVSMLRADLLDAIDLTLKTIRKRRNEAFGGVQMLFIGDLLQLPPVVKDDEWQILSRYYPSPFFFESRVLADQSTVNIELQNIYRQKDDAFIAILNRLRHNEQNEQDIERLNDCHDPEITGDTPEGYIFLTTHNAKADRINARQLKNIEGEIKIYDALIEGDFPDHILPTRNQLELKLGAQVMFIKNDPTGEGRFFNGKIATISSLEEDEIGVRFETGKEIFVEAYKWENKRYELNEEDNSIEEKLIGSFEQFPVKLAWAVTVHKSQGLTFEKAILDLSDTFAPGQLYVALSRLTSLEGLILASKLPENPPEIDMRLRQFNDHFDSEDILVNRLSQYQKTFLIKRVQRSFNFIPLLRELQSHLNSFNKEEGKSIKQKYKEWTMDLLNESASWRTTGESFIGQAQNILQKEDGLEFLAERLDKAKNYFIPLIQSQLDKIDIHFRAIKDEKKVKAYLEELEELEAFFERQKQLIADTAFYVGKAAGLKMDKGISESEKTNNQVKKEKRKQKTPTVDITLGHFKSGKSIEQIAELRDLAFTTIESHLAQCVENGEVEVTELISKDKIEILEKAIEKNDQSLSDIKAKVSDDISYGDIKVVLAYKNRLKQKLNSKAKPKKKSKD